MNLSTDHDHPNVRVPPPLIFFGLLCIASALEYWVRPDYPRAPLELRCSIALILFVISGYLALHALVVLTKRGTYIDPGKPTTQIAADGPYRFSRNPMYLSLLLVLLALAVLFLSIWFFSSAICLWLLVARFAISPEELYLEQKFGDRYTEYKAKVRRWI